MQLVENSYIFYQRITITISKFELRNSGWKDASKTKQINFELNCFINVLAFKLF